MSARETSAPEEEEGADKEEVAFVVFTRGHFATSYATLLWIDSLLMAPMTWKRGKGGMVTCKYVNMRVIAEGKMSLSRVVMS